MMQVYLLGSSAAAAALARVQTPSANTYILNIKCVVSVVSTTNFNCVSSDENGNVLGCPFPFSDSNHSLSAEAAAEAASASSSDGKCAVISEAFSSLLPLLPQTAAPSIWYSVRIW